MPDWLIVYLGSFQGGIMRDLAAELRAMRRRSTAATLLARASHPPVLSVLASPGAPHRSVPTATGT